MSAKIAVKVGDRFVLQGLGSPLYQVIKVIRDGLAVLKTGSDDPEIISFETMLEAYKKRSFRHWPADIEAMEASKAEKLLTAFTAWPPAYRREATRRLAYVSHVHRRRVACGTIRKASEEAREQIYAENISAWQIEEQNAALAEYSSRRHRCGETFDGPQIRPKKVGRASARTIEVWYADWRAAGQDICALIPGWHRRGCRKPFYKVVEKASGLTTYDIAKSAIDDVYMTLTRPSATAAWLVYKRRLEVSKLPDSELIKERGFRDYINQLYTPEQQCLARRGRRKAYLEHGVFIPQDLPDTPLEEVEIDHCLVDVILLHKDGRVAGRPWITVLLDRATRCLIGIHITFQAPSYQSVRLALAHSAYPKDLSGFRSIRRKWECYGVPKYLISDQGKEFKSASYKSSCAALNITPVLLPGRMPWLKGAIERLFGHMGIAVFDLMEGATKFNSVDAYRSAKSARLDKDEFTERLLRWIVDRYHHRPHPALAQRYGVGTTPSMAWEVLTNRYGIRLARDPEQLHLITGEVFDCRINSDGIRIGPNWYLDKQFMERMRKVHGPKKRWRIHRDDTDWGYIRLLDDTQSIPRWYTIKNANYELMSGVSKEQFRMIYDEAKEMTREGSEVRVDTLARAKKRIEDENAALSKGKWKKSATHKFHLAWTKYGDLGTLVTPVPGFEHQVAANDHAPLELHDAPPAHSKHPSPSEARSEEACHPPVARAQAAVDEAEEEDTLADEVAARLKLRMKRA